MPAVKNEGGFGLVELLIAMVVLNVALLAIVAAFSAGAVAVSRAGSIATASALADQQMELYRAMPYEPIGLDTAGAPGSGAYVSDTACVSGGSTTCSNTGPRDNTNATSATWSCTATSGATSVSANFSANNVNPCVAHRVVDSSTTPASPDRKSYVVDTYIYLVSGTAQQRPTKRVTVVVRDATGRAIARSASTFDCSTGQVPGAAPC